MGCLDRTPEIDIKDKAFEELILKLYHFRSQNYSDTFVPKITVTLWQYAHDATLLRYYIVTVSEQYRFATVV